MLREKIESLVEHSASPEEAALLIILYLEEEAGLSLEGNGWLTGDPAWEELNEDDSAEMERLRQKLEAILV